MGDVEFSGLDQIEVDDEFPPPVPLVTRFTGMSCGTIGVYPCIVRFALVAAVVEELVMLVGMIMETARPSFAVCKRPLIKRRCSTAVELDPVTDMLAAIRALVAHESRMEAIPLIDDTAAVRPVTYSEESTRVGVHMLGVVSTNMMSASAGTELMLKVYTPPTPLLTPTHTCFTQVDDPSQETQYAEVPLQI